MKRKQTVEGGSQEAEHMEVGEAGPTDQAAFERLKATLVSAFSSSENTYQLLTATEIIARNRQRG